MPKRFPPCLGCSRLAMFLYLIALPAAGQAQNANASTTPASDTTTERTAVTGQRAAENALRAADDGFGTQVGRESVGIYNTDKVRGFSPVDAGNIRIDGLYFDQVVPLDSHLIEAANIRVGAAALGKPFPAPTGIVDYSLRKPGDAVAVSLLAAGDGWGTGSFEADISLPVVNERLSVAGGISVNHFNDFTGARTNSLQLAAAARWTPTPDIEIVPFASRERQNGSIGVLYQTAGDYLPPLLSARRNIGPGWARSIETLSNYGVLGTVQLATSLTLRAGLFRSISDSPINTANLLIDVTPDGHGSQLVIIDPPSTIASTSGEVRLSRAFADGPRRHQIHLSLRGRSSDRVFDGSDYLDLGPATIGVVATAPEPSLHFTEQQRDHVRQYTFGIAYEGRWQGIGELGIGVSRTDYRKRIGLPGLTPVRTVARPWLFNVNAAVVLAPGLKAYAGYVTGLEESGTAPDNAVNRNEALPAIETSQRDAGLRWAVTPKIALIAGVFDVRKPYYNLGVDGRFARLGNVVNRGVEASIAGAVTPSITIVTGAVLLQPRVSGDDVTRGLVGPRPVGSVVNRIQGNVDWHPDFAKGASIDAKVTYQSSQVATTDNRVAIPPRATVDLGGRYTFKLAGKEATLRLQIVNLFDRQLAFLRGAGIYDLVPRRLVSGYVTVDF